MDLKKKNWSGKIDSIKIKDCLSIKKQIEIDGLKIDYWINILNRESPNLVVNIPGVGDNGLKDLKYFSETFDSGPFFNVITFSNPKPYVPETVTKSVYGMLSNIGNEIPKSKAIILHAYSQGGVATWDLLNNGSVLKEFPVKGVIFQVPLINKENSSLLLRMSVNHLDKLIGQFVQDSEKWKQEMGSALETNIEINPKIETPTLLIRFDNDKLIDYKSTEGVLKRSFTNVKMVDFKSNRQMAGHDTDDWVSVMKAEIKFMEDCFSEK